MKEISIRRQKRKMLLQSMAQYLDAAVYAEPTMCRLDPKVRATFNGEVIQVGDNEIWKEALYFPCRQTFVDWEMCQATFIGTATNEAILEEIRTPYPKKAFKWDNIREHNRSSCKWWYYFVRLHLNENGYIDEIEEISLENHLIHFKATPQDYPQRYHEFDWPIAIEDRMSREEMILAADSYFDGLNRLCDWDQVLAHPDAMRYEEGEHCTNTKTDFHSLRTGFLNPLLKWEIANRRYVVVDETMGIVVAIVEFVTTGEKGCSPGFVAVEAFKVVDGLFRDIIVTHRPMCLKSGWEGGVPQYKTEKVSDTESNEEGEEI